jgi:hypothetical protein
MFQKAWSEKMKWKKDQRMNIGHPFLEITPKQINKVKQPKMSTNLQIHLGKGQGNNLYNVRDVREITYIGNSLTKGKE